MPVGSHAFEANMRVRDKIFEKYRSKSKRTDGGEVYVEGEAALGIPADCEAANIVIIGVETFTIIPGATYPHLDGILDYSPRVQRSWDDFRQRCNKAALKFMQDMLAEKGANTYFTFVIIDADDYDSCLRELR